jgi:hypothetical protein
VDQRVRDDERAQGKYDCEHLRAGGAPMRRPADLSLHGETRQIRAELGAERAVGHLNTH